MSGQYVEVKIRAEKFLALSDASDVTGRSINDLLDEALGQYLECDVPCMIEEAASKVATA